MAIDRGVQPPTYANFRLRDLAANLVHVQRANLGGEFVECCGGQEAGVSRQENAVAKDHELFTGCLTHAA
jgi:hypothetical protein